MRRTACNVLVMLTCNACVAVLVMRVDPVRLRVESSRRVPVYYY
jgi:hypothetical protein